MTPAPQNAPRHRTVCTEDGVVLPVVEVGDPGATPVVLVHGLASSSSAWTSVMQDPDLVRGHRLIAFDLRGHGQDPAPLDAEQAGATGALSGERLWAQDLDAVVDDLRAPHLVGWSFGCTVIQGWMHARGGTGGTASTTLVCGPDVLGPVAPPDPAATLIGPEAVAALAGAASGGEHAFAERILTRGPADTTVDPDLLEQVASTAAGTRPEAVQAAFTYTFDYRSFLAALPPEDHRRLTVLVCEQDRLFDSSAMQACWDHAGVRSHLVTGEAHAFPLRDPGRLARALVDLLPPVDRP